MHHITHVHQMLIIHCMLSTYIKGGKGCLQASINQIKQLINETINHDSSSMKCLVFQNQSQEFEQEFGRDEVSSLRLTIVVLVQSCVLNIMKLVKTIVVLVKSCVLNIMKLVFIRYFCVLNHTLFLFLVRAWLSPFLLRIVFIESPKGSMHQA